MDLSRNLRYAFRTLRKTPAFSALTILILALGIGANTAIFSLVSTVLLRELPYRSPEQLVWAWSVRPENRGAFNVPDFIDYRDRNRTLASIAAFTDINANLIGQGDPIRLPGFRVSANLFELLGVKAALGRTLVPEDDRPGSAAAVVITDGMWRARLSADPSVIGRKLLLNGSPYNVVGVLPPDFIFPRAANAEYAIPLAADADPARMQRGSINILTIVGRLRSGVSMGQAQAEFASIATQLRSENPQANALKRSVQLTALRDEILGSSRNSLNIAAGAVSLLLLIVLVNVANSLLARAMARGKDLAIRASLGASRAQLIAQPLLESLVLTGAGSALGIVFAKWTFATLRDLVPGFPRAGLAEIDGAVLAYAAGLSLAIGLLIGLIPAWRLSAVSTEQLRSRDNNAGRQSRSIRSSLILAEVALSFAMLLGAGLMSQNLARLMRAEPGFDSKQLVAVSVSLPRDRYRDQAAIQGFLDRLAFDSDRQVAAHSVVSIFPLSGTLSQAPFMLRDTPVTRDRRPFTQYRFVEPNYFATMRIPLRQGVDFSAADDAAARPVAIVNEQFARQFLAGRSPIGVHLLVTDNDKGPRDVEIIGVAANVDEASLAAKPLADLYIPLRQVPNETNGFLTRGFTIVARSIDSQPLAPAMRKLILSAEPEAALTAQTADDIVSASLSVRRYLAILMDIFAAFATALAGFGLYSVISYLTAQRLPEIGIRLALGATPRGVANLVIRQALVIAAAGIAVGALIAAAAYRIAAIQAYIPTIFDPVMLFSSVAVLLSIAALASWLPARRAARIDPVTMLRGE